jgi:hypothetical protein
MDHYQNIDPDRFFSNIGFDYSNECTYCQKITAFNCNVSYYIGDDYTYICDTLDMNDSEVEQYWIDHVFPKLHALNFQCVDCGDIHLVSDFEDLKYIAVTETKCPCGGILSRAHPIHCVHCKIDKEVLFNVRQFIAGEELKYLRDGPEYTFPRQDMVKRHLKKVEVEVEVEVESNELTLDHVRSVFACRFRADHYSNLGKWHLYISFTQLLHLYNPLKPNTEILELDYSKLPLEPNGSGTFRIRLISLETGKFIQSKTYQTPDTNSIEWTYNNLGDILDKDWGGQ